MHQTVASTILMLLTESNTISEHFLKTLIKLFYLVFQIQKVGHLRCFPARQLLLHLWFVLLCQESIGFGAEIGVVLKIGLGITGILL